MPATGRSGSGKPAALRWATVRAAAPSAEGLVQAASASRTTMAKLKRIGPFSA
jgi:hypothetical protein